MSKVNLEGKIPLETVLVKFNEHNKEFIKNLENEDSIEKVETLDSINNDILATRANTDMKKRLFINEIKSGLGDMVKNNPNGVIVIKKKWYQKIGIFIKNIFTKF